MDSIATTSICKYYGTTKAAQDISINVKEGEIYGFLGLNGAGKTTLIRMLLGMIKPDSGSIQIFDEKLGKNFQQWNRIGYLVETPYSYPQLTVLENLQVYYELRNLADPSCIDRVIDCLKLTQYKDKKAGLLSLGNQQRLGIAKALLHTPELLILDEPINGLDPEGIVEIRELLKELSRNGVTIFLSSHILDEIAKIANRIGIIHNGVLLKELEINELVELLHKKLIIDTSDNSKAATVLNLAGYSVVQNNVGESELNDKQICEQPEEVTKILVNEGLYPKKILVLTEDLEEFFLRTIRSKT